eukprot:scaffold40836_cov68-Phaeocystis_antarctica.AAC.1
MHKGEAETATRTPRKEVHLRLARVGGHSEEIAMNVVRGHTHRAHAYHTERAILEACPQTHVPPTALQPWLAHGARRRGERVQKA